MIVIGCGESGLLAGIRLKEAGIPFTIVEKNAGVGGTWWPNTYPGARVDVGNHFYCYSFEPTDQWTHFFAEQPELQAYFQTVMDKYDVGSHVLWETEVTEASWDDDTATWSVRARDRNGATTTLSARAVISAVGQLNRPHLPDIDGQQDFAGPALHSSEWDHSVDLRGKRVAMMGASGFQIAPAIAGDVDRVTVFQRTAQWMFPNPNYHAEVGPGVQWAQLLLHVRSWHQPRARRHPELSLRVLNALHHRVFRAASRRRARLARTARGQGDGLARTQPGRDAQAGVVTASVKHSF